MEREKIGYDTHQKKDVYKLQYSDDDIPRRQFFNSEDVISGNPSSNIAIGFIYTWADDRPPEKVREFFQRVSNYAYLTGFWKTTNGARYVFSNLLANPNVNKLLLFVFDNQDNGHLLVEALTNFWEKGIDQDGKIIDSKSPNPRFEQVPKEALERLNKQTDLVVKRNISEANLEEAEDLVKSLMQEPENAREVAEGVEFYSEILNKNILYDDGCRFDEPYVLDLTKGSKKPVYEEKEPGFAIAKSVHARNLADALENIAGFVFSQGSIFRDQRNILICETRSFTVSIEQPLETIPEGFSKEYVDKYVKEFMHGEGEGLDGFTYTYHDRLFNKWGNQVERGLKALKDNPNTRRCLMSLWDPANDLDSSNPTCLDFIWAAVRENKLEMHVVFRSHHLVTVTKDGRIMQGEGAFVPNMFALGTLQKYMAEQLDISPGYIVLTDFSGHLYVSEV